MIKRICILGGGFGGLFTALHLAKLPWAEPPELVLVDRHEHFLFSPLLYELITAELPAWQIAPSFERLLQDTAVKFCQGTVTQIDLEHQSIGLADRERQIAYDYLVLALGGETPMGLVLGAAEHALSFRTLADAHKLNARLTLLENSDRAKIRVCIVGGGASGVELACKISDRLQSRGRVRLVDRHGQILAKSPRPNRLAGVQALAQRGVWCDLSTQVIRVNADYLELEHQGQQQQLPVDLVLWTVGNSYTQLVQRLDLAHVGQQLAVQPDLSLPDHPQIFALGDLAHCYDSNRVLVPTTAQAAYQQAQYCAWNIWARIHGQPLTPFVYLPLGEFISLGI
ncbi:MAG: FAD-dependent oxidoreductase, partial [Pseudanabaenaceae cyanobacterium bins.68]|nr:FAD-dependent oxidoreductase [Pseudanabaenaceae cyanobacterium bins.68]